MQQPNLFTFSILFFTLSISLQSFSQDDKKNEDDARNNTVGINVQLPLGEFSETHSFGIGLTYSRGDYRTIRIKQATPKKISFTYQAGVAWYKGRTETILNQIYDYPSFIYIHAYGGVKYKISSNTDLKLLAGPALAIYDGHSHLNFGSDLSAGFYLKENFSINPSIGIQAENGIAPRAVVKLGVQYGF